MGNSPRHRVRASVRGLAQARDESEDDPERSTRSRSAIRSRSIRSRSIRSRPIRSRPIRSRPISSLLPPRVHPSPALDTALRLTLRDFGSVCAPAPRREVPRRCAEMSRGLVWAMRCEDGPQTSRFRPHLGDAVRRRPANLPVPPPSGRCGAKTARKPPGSAPIWAMRCEDGPQTSRFRPHLGDAVRRRPANLPVPPPSGRCGAKTMTSRVEPRVRATFVLLRCYKDITNLAVERIDEMRPEPGLAGRCVAVALLAARRSGEHV